MTAVGLAFLVACIFGAVAYGSATMMAFRQSTPVWGGASEPARSSRLPIDGVSLTMFITCTVWFALNAVAEFRALAFGGRRLNGIELAVVALAFVFPPLIMHLVFRETRTACDGEPAAHAWG